jgi:hypothetical protein
MYMLIEHPEIEERLRKEVMEKVGSERCPTSDNIREMRYLKAFLNGKHTNNSTMAEC